MEPYEQTAEGGQFYAGYISRLYSLGGVFRELAPPIRGVYGLDSLPAILAWREGWRAAGIDAAATQHLAGMGTGIDQCIMREGDLSIASFWHRYINTPLPENDDDDGRY